MLINNKSKVPKRERNGLVSHILLQKGDVPYDRLAITWVDVTPGSGQRQHSHVPEQVFVIIQGTGRMRIGKEKRDVGKGDMIYIPSNSVHNIENFSDEMLSYISAATPAFDLKALYDTGNLQGG